MSPAESERSSDASEGRLELLAALRFVFRNWYWVLGGAAVIGSAMLAISLVMQRTYEARVTAMPVKDQQGMSSLRSMISGYGALASLAGMSMPGADNPAEMAVVRMTSRGFLEEFIEEQELLPELFPDRWDAGLRSWRTDGSSPPTNQDGYLLLKRHVLRAMVDKRAGVVSVTIRWNDPVKAAAWANMLVERLNRVTRQSAIEEASTSVSYLTAELAKAEYVELRQSIAMLLEGQLNKRMLAATQPDFSLKVIDAARPSDTGRYVSPRRLVMVVAGAIAGAMLGTLLAFLYSTPAVPRGAESGSN